MNTAPLATAYEALRRQKKRTLLTMLAISIGISAAITIMAAGKGMQRFVLGQLDAFGPDTLSIQTKVPSQKQSGGPGSVGITITTLKDRDIETVAHYSNIRAAYGAVTGQEAVSYQGQIKKVMLMGQGWAMPEVETFTLSLGRFYTKEEEDGIAPVAVLGATAREKLFGDENPIDKTIYIRGKPFKVIGVMAKRGAAFFFDMDNIITLPTKTMQKRLLGIDYVQSIAAKMKDVAKGSATKADLTELIRSNHQITDADHDDFQLDTTADATATLTTVTGGITLLLVALVGISLLVGGVGIMNIMYVSVVERTFEIGLRKSLGAKQKDILWQFLWEAVLITLGGDIIGIIWGAIVALLIYFLATAAGFKWVYDVSFGSILLAVGFSGTIGLIFGLYPARKAAKLHPIDALRQE